MKSKQLRFHANMDKYSVKPINQFVKLIQCHPHEVLDLS